jgi:hypothetical protein
MTGFQVTIVDNLEKELHAEINGAERAVTAAIRLAGTRIGSLNSAPPSPIRPPSVPTTAPAMNAKVSHRFSTCSKP